MSFVALANAGPVLGQTPISVSNSTDFTNAIQTINNNPNTSYTLNLTANVTMSQQVLAIESNATITVVGNGHTIDGASLYRPFFVESGTVALQNLTVANGMAQGGAGGAGDYAGGGGLGAGGAVFVDSAGHLSLQNVNFATNIAHGGAGGSFTNASDWEAGGGGMGGNGGASNQGQGGGGGLYGAGGSSASVGSGGGGGGELGHGGVGAISSGFNSGGGGGGGGTTANGADGTVSAGGAGGGAQGGAGGFNATNGVSGSSGGGGGGGGYYSGSGANGGKFGGGGGAGYWYTNEPSGGNGGTGGGGGAGWTSGGNGGFGGGGGSGYNAGGNGGFGGGGGSNASGGTTGSGGFGGGNAGLNTGYIGTGGGGGAGYGGAVFVVAGGTITVVNGTTFSGNTVTAGAGGAGDVASGGNATNGGNGSAGGNDLFLMRGVTSTFNITGNNTYTFSPVIGNADGTSNAGVAIDKTGTGTLTLTGNSQLVGSTAVDAGALVANGTLGGTMSVNNGGTLMGDGTVGATTVNSGGTIYPGTVGAPLAISGNFIQQSGSTFAAEINPTASDRINVTGAAQINSGATLQVVVDPGSYTVGHTYTLLAATGSITGHYSFLMETGGSLGFSVIYDPHDIELMINSIGTNFAHYAQTPNQFAVGTALDASSGTATGDYQTVITQLQTLNSSQLPGAMNQLAGDIYPSIGAIELQTTTAWMQLISNRLAGQLRPVELGGTAPEPAVAVAGQVNADVKLVSYTDSDGQVRREPCYTFTPVSTVPRWTGWTQGYGLGGSVASNGNAGGLNYGLGGSLVGMDRWIDDNTVVGGFGGYAGTSLGDRLVGSHAAISAGQVGLYQLHRRGRFYLSNVDAFSNDGYKVTRPIDFGTINRTATGNSYGNQWAHYSEAGMSLGSGRTMLQPFAGLQYIYLAQGGYSETGAGSLDLSTSNQYVNSVRGNFWRPRLSRDDVGGHTFHPLGVGPLSA